MRKKKRKKKEGKKRKQETKTIDEMKRVRRDES